MLSEKEVKQKQPIANSSPKYGKLKKKNDIYALQDLHHLH